MTALLDRPRSFGVNYAEWLEKDYQPLAGGALESNINGIWFAKQAAKGSPVTFTVGTKRGRWVAGDLQTNRADGNENYSDQTLFADSVDYINTLIGNGSPAVQAQSGLVAYLSWIACGQETVTGGVNAVQTLSISSTPTSGNFTLQAVVNGVTYPTANIAFNAIATAVASAVQAILPFSGGTVTGTGGPLPGTPVVLTFTGNLAAQPVPVLTLGTNALGGGTSPTPSVAQTTVGVGFQHVATPTDTGGFWFGVAKSVGKTVVHRVQYNDCRMQSLRLEGSSAQKVCRATATFLSLDPGQIITADPSKTDDGTVPFIFTEAVGQINIDGTLYDGVPSFAVVFNWALQEYYGDDVVPFDVINQQATCTLEGLSLLIDSAGITRYNQQIYNTPTPAVGAKPTHSLPPVGSFSIMLQKVNPLTAIITQSMKIEVFGVRWAPDLNIPANPDGGAVELALAGSMRKTAANPPFRITTVNFDAAYSS